MEQSIYLPRIFSSKVDANAIFVIIFFIIYPLGALPFILLEIYNKKRYAFSLLAIFVGICSLLAAPVWDLARHNGWFFGFQDTSSSLSDLLSTRSDYVIWVMEYLFAKNGINFEIIRFLLLYIEYEMIFWIFRDVVRRNTDIYNSNGMYVITFILIFLSGAFFHSTNGLRYGIAEVSVACGAYKLFLEKGYTGWWFVVFGILCHIGTITFLPLIIVVKFIKKLTLSRDSTVIILIALFFIGAIAVKSFIQGIYSNDEDSDILSMGSAYVEGQNIEGMFSFMYLYFICGYGEITAYPLSIWFLVSSEYRTTEFFQYKNYIIASLFLLSATVTFPDLAIRWLTIITLCMVPYFLLHYRNHDRRYSFWLVVLLFTLLFSTGVKSYYFRGTYLVGKTYMLYDSSLPTLMSQTYTEEEVEDCEYRSQVILGNVRSRGGSDE